MFTNQTHRNFAGRIYFPVLITPESLSALFTFFWPALNLRPKEKLYARRMTNKRELSFKYMLLRNEAYCDLFSESCLNVFINGLKTPAPTINPYTCIPHIGFAPVHRPSWSPRKSDPNWHTSHIQPTTVSIRRRRKDCYTNSCIHANRIAHG